VSTRNTIRDVPANFLLINDFSDDEIDFLLHDWSFLARDEQFPPEITWTHWLYLAGRGAGKTRTGSEFVRMKVKEGCMRLGLIAPTAGDVRDVMVEGESGILACAFANDYDDNGVLMGVPEYQPSKRRLVWANGSQAALYSADEPERLRGPQHDFIWADELCAWRRPETWDLAMFGLRLGDNPQAFISTTPKPKKLIIDLMQDPHCAVTRGTTYDNKANLADNFFKTVVTKYEGTRLGQQELMGDLLMESADALWTREVFDETRLARIPTHEGFWFTRIVVCVDPATTSNKDSDQTGICVVALGNDGHGYILADYSGRYTPGQWARRTKWAYDLWQADVVVAEGNQGGEMVDFTLKSVDANLNVKRVHASRGKMARAEPVAALFEQRKCHVVGCLPDLEDQCCVWEPNSGEPSPDRLDAMVWGFHELMVGKGTTSHAPLKGMY